MALTAATAICSCNVDRDGGTPHNGAGEDDGQLLGGVPCKYSVARGPVSSK